MVDITTELRHDPLNRADPEPDWQGEIPALGEPVPGSDSAGMDAEALPFTCWYSIYFEEPWMADMPLGFWD